MKTKNISAIIPASSYIWYSVKSSFILNRRGKEYTFKSGDSIGLRESSNKKMIRLISKELGDTIVFSLDADDNAFLQKRLTKLSQKDVDTASRDDTLRKSIYSALKKIVLPTSVEQVTLDYVNTLDSVAKAFSKVKKPKDVDNALSLIDSIVLKGKAKKGKQSVPEVTEYFKPRNYKEIFKNTLQDACNAPKYNDETLEEACADVGMYLDIIRSHLQIVYYLYTYNGTSAEKKKIYQSMSLDSYSKSLIPTLVWDWYV